MILIECEHMACVKGPHGTYHHIMFKPTPSTVSRVNAWRASEEAHGLKIKDCSGEHVRTTEAYAIEVKHSYNTLIVTTDR